MIDYSIKNPLVVNLFLFLVVVIGIVSWQSMPEEMFPVVEKDAIKIITEYDGASPEEVEKQVTIPIEDTLDNIEDIDFYYSTSSEGASSVTLRLKPEADVDELLRTTRDLVDAIDGFPEEAEEPEISKDKTRFPVISVSIFGETRQSLLFSNAKKIKQKIMQLDGVAGVGIAGNRDDEIWVIIDPSIISAKKISTNEIITALRSNIRDLPGGSVKAIEGDILLRGLGSSSIKSIENITLKNNEIGGQLLLKEVASIEQRLEDENSVGRFNGKKAVNMSITKTADASVFDVSKGVREIIQNFSLPSGLEVSVFGDFSKNVKTRLDTVIYRAKFAPTVFSARQLINHGHFRVNKKKVNISSYTVKENDLIEIKDKSKSLTIIEGCLSSKERDVPEYIQYDTKNKTAKLVRVPKFADIPYPTVMEPKLVIEYYSR